MSREPGSVTIAPMQSLRLLFAPLNARRAIVLTLFVLLVFFFREVLPLLVFFVAFQRPLAWTSEQLERRLRVSQPVAVFSVVALSAGILFAAGAFGAGKIYTAVDDARRDLPDKIAEFRNTELYARVHELLSTGSEDLLQKAKDYAEKSMHVLATAGRLAIQACSA